MNAAHQRRLTPVLGGVAVVLGVLLLLLLGGVGRGVSWKAPRTLPPLPPAGNSADLPQPKPLQEFSVVWQQPLFNPDRKPIAHAAAGGSNLGDLQLTGIIITPGLRMALLHDKNGDKEIRLRQGDSLPDGSVTLVEVQQRSAVFDSAAGRTELKLPAGALIDTDGKLVGINTAILSRSGGYQGIGLAIPSSMAQPIMETLKQSGKVSRGFLGVGIQDVDRDLATALKLSGPNGVLLTEVRAGGPAGKAGLLRGDVVTKVDGKVITSTGQFRNVIASSGAKKKVSLEVMRDGKPQTFAVELGDLPEDGKEAAGGPQGGPPQATAGGALAGVTFEELTPEHRRTLGLSQEQQRGVVITDLAPGSSAAKAGLRPGDVVLELNRVSVDSLAKFKEQYGKATGDVLLLVQRRGGTVFLVVRK